MKMGLPLALVLCLVGSGALGQSQTKAAVTTQSSATAGTETRIRLPSENGQSLPGANVIQKGKFQASGPLVQPFKAKKGWEVPGRLLHLINPFAPAEPKPEFENSGELSPRAWTSVAGWSCGRSAFPDPVTHEPSLGLISVSRTKR